MKTSTDEGISGVDALILCGGLGTRLRPLISDRPKSLVPLGGKPLLDILVDELLRQGCRRIIFCVGHMQDQIVGHYRGRHDAEYVFSSELSPLGTGGAVMNALPSVRGNTMLVMNGDSICDIDYGALLRFHRTKQAAASLVVTLAQRKDGGLLSLDTDSRVTAFQEKPGENVAHGRYISAGVYMLQNDATNPMGRKPPFSLENDVFPALVAARQCYGMVVDSTVLDIGTPERYQGACRT